jgi:hypothetical protein
MSNIAIMVGLMVLGCVIVGGVLLALAAVWSAEHE